MMENLDDLFVTLFLRDKATFVDKKNHVELELTLFKNPKRLAVHIRKTRGNCEGYGSGRNSVAEAKAMIRDRYLKITGCAFPETNPEERTWYMKLRNGKYYPLCVSVDKPKLTSAHDCYAVHLRNGRYPELDWDRDEQNPDIMYIPKDVIWEITDDKE